MNLDWVAEQGLERLPQFLTALAIGLLIGLERERKPTAKAGLRTFALVALAGAMSATLAETFAAPAIIAVGLGAVALMMIAAYYHHHEAFHEWDPGTTTIVAVIGCYLLGAMTLTGFARLAVILGILATALLYFKEELGGVARRLERRDLVSMLQFVVVAFVVLPLLPDRGFGPYAALNPRHIWLMVVLISGVSLAGYVALRLVGREHGAILQPTYMNNTTDQPRTATLPMTFPIGYHSLHPDASMNFQMNRWFGWVGEPEPPTSPRQFDGMFS